MSERLATRRSLLDMTDISTDIGGGVASDRGVGVGSGTNSGGGVGGPTSGTPGGAIGDNNKPSSSSSSNNNNSRSPTGYVSPLTAILMELKRKHAVAAAATTGPQLSLQRGSLTNPLISLEYGSNPTTSGSSGIYNSAFDFDYSSDLHDSILATKSTTAVTDNSSGGTNKKYDEESSMCVCVLPHRIGNSESYLDRRRRSSLLGGGRTFGEVAAITSRPPEAATTDRISDDGEKICSNCGKRKSFDPLGQALMAEVSNFDHSSSSRQQQLNHNSRGMMATSQNVLHHRRRRSTRRTYISTSLMLGTGGSATSPLPAEEHAEALLQSTPHLRHLSPASTDMQGYGHVKSSRNIFSAFLPSPSSPSNIQQAHHRPSSLGISTPSHHSSTSTYHGFDSQSVSSSTAASSSPILGNPLDYRSCLIRDKANLLAATELSSFLWILTHEMSLEDYGAVENEVFAAVFALVHSADKERRIAGVAALDQLIDAPSADEEKKAIKFANNLRNGLRAPQGDFEFLAAVSKALGHMATGAANVDMVETEVTRALEWLCLERSDRRLAAALTLKELAINAPTAFYSKTTQSTIDGSAATPGAKVHNAGGSNQFLNNIFVVLRDSQPIVRACAADALSQCLKIVVERQHVSVTGLLCQIYFEMMDGLQLHSSEQSSKNGGNSHKNTKKKKEPSGADIAKMEAAQHGSLLAVTSMLEYTRNFMLPRFDEICTAVFAFMNHSKALIRLEIVRLIPRLARYCPDVFGRRYLDQGLVFLLQSAKNTPTSQRAGIEIRPTAFTAIGQLVLAMSDEKGGGVIGGEKVPTVRILPNPVDTADENGNDRDGIEKQPSWYKIEHSETGIIYDKRAEIFELVRNGLKKSLRSASSRGTATSANTRYAALHTGADLVEALGDIAKPYIGDLLDHMFGSGLSEDLIQCLHSIAVCVPSQKLVIEERLLQEVSLCLAGTMSAKEICDPLTFSSGTEKISLAYSGLNHGSPTSNRLGPQGVYQEPVSRFSSQYGRDDPVILRRSTVCDQEGVSARVLVTMSDRPEVVSNLVLSLRTLGSFVDDKGRATTSSTAVNLLPFVRDVAAHYLFHPSSEVRQAAALTCCTLLNPIGAQRSSVAQHSSPHAVLKHRVGPYSGRVIEEVLQQLLRVAVSDPSPVVRLCVVRAFLDSWFDPFLCQTRHLQPLFLLIQDEALATRATGLQLLGRLTRLNPAPILPNLRRFLVDLIVELRSGSDAGRGREAASRLLIVYLRAEPLQRLIQPVLPSLISALPLKGVAPRVASAALEALGELAQAVRTDLTPWLGEFIPHILETMQDQSSASKQRTSLRTLGQIAGATIYVIRPYLDYPQLLSQAADVLPGTKRAPWALRREVIRTLGILGALDPDHYHTVAPKTIKGGAVGGAYFIEQEDSKDTAKDDAGDLSRSSTNSASTAAAVGQSEAPGAAMSPSRFKSESLPHKRIENIKEADDDMPAHLYMYDMYAMAAQPVSKLPPARRMTPADEEFYPTVAIQALTRIFKEPALAVHHGMVMQAIMFIFNSLGLRCVPFLKRVVPQMIHAIRTCGPSNLREALLKQVATLSSIVREHLRPYVAAIFDIVEEFWGSRHLGTILALVSKIAAGVPDEFVQYVPRLVHKLLASLEEIQVADWLMPYSSRGDIVGSTGNEIEKLELILRSVRSLRLVLSGFMHLLIPALLKLAESLIAPASDASTSTLSDVAILTLQTSSVLLERDCSSVSTRAIVVPIGEQHSALPSTSSLPARAAQSLMRMLGSDLNANREVGLAVVETLCVCAKQLGHYRWKPLYHLSARDAISSWQFRVGINTDLTSSTEGRGISNRPLVGLALYDEVVRELDIAFQRQAGGAFSMSREAYRMAVPLHRQDSLRRGSSVGDVLSIGIEAPGFGGMFDGSTDPLEGDIQNNPSIQPLVLNQTSRHRINQGNLQRAWDVSQRASREDWDEWMRRLAIQLLREAPSPALRACASLAHAYQPLASELFSAAFVCCWEELSEQYRANLVHSLETAFVADVSPEILQTLLNLAEFMEHDGVESGLPIDISKLADLALKCRAYAKALHYKEREATMGGGGSCVEALISINKKLELPEAALGVLKAARIQLERRRLKNTDDLYIDEEDRAVVEGKLSSQLFRHGNEMLYSVVSSTDDTEMGGVAWAGVEVQESWLSKLGSWYEALAMYEKTLEQNPHDVDAILGCMRCLDARGEWQRVLDLGEKSWPDFSGSLGDNRGKVTESTRRHSSIDSKQIPSRNRRKVLKFWAQAAWRLGRWETLERCAAQLCARSPLAAGGTIGVQDSVVPRVDFDGAFFSAVLHIHRKEWSLAADAIDAARKAMDSRFTALMAESYKRAYPSMVTAQTLAEMEEIIEYRKLEGRAKASAHRHPANRPNKDEARQHLLSVWRDRLAGCRVDDEVHFSIMEVRSLVLGPTDEVEATLTLSDLSRQAQRFKLAETVLLDPLKKLGADLNGNIFGFRAPVSLGLGLDDRTLNVPLSSIVDRLVVGDAKSFLPQYGPMHEQYSKQLVQEAESLERLTIQHRLYFAYIKHLWYMDHHSEAMNRLEKLSSVVDLISHCERTNDCSLRVSCWLTLGEWKMAETTSPGSFIPEQLQVDVLTAFKRATATSECDYKAWHAWALLNFRVAQQISDREEGANLLSIYSRQTDLFRSLTNHVIAAVKGFVNAIRFATKRSCASVQQDMLNLLTCLFKYGELPDVANNINEGMKIVTLEAWLGVLPQLLARIHIRSPSVRSVLHPLLIRLGEKHPQALMYPLSVLLKSPVAERREAAESLMNSLKGHSSALVEEALMVSSELIRVAILWLETWHEGLEEASRQYFGEGSVQGMLDILLPLHEQLENGAETRREHDFVKTFGNDLAEAHAYVKEYIRLDGVTSARGPEHQRLHATHGVTGSSEEAEAAMNKAWDIYYTVFRRINKQLPALTKLELSHCSPALSRAHNLELGVPGTYRARDGSYVNIEKFIPSVQVITSKQRPRKITLRGSDGKDYVFLLKGHEDLRQDERVMQLFGLVNALLARDRRTNRHDLNIQRYAISPLSHNCGVVGWVPHCDTLHSLIRDYRQLKKVPLNMENREMLKISPDYDMLTVMQKAEVFNDALRKTTGNGNDLYEILWIKSTNSEEWLERRTKYTRSLAVMSMVGYILGLGDRHPSNLMLDSISGRVLHIDFGDCFEVAMNREKYPEKVPFRLTRMLIKAMEVSGIEGSYRSTCERTMGVLRDNRDSLVAILEAFVYDPLISWRLVDLSGEEDSAGQRTPAPVENNETHRSPRTETHATTSRQAVVKVPNRNDTVNTDMAQSVLYDSISEAVDEDGDDANANTVVREDQGNVNVTDGGEAGGISAPADGALAITSHQPTGRSVSRDDAGAAMSAARAKSLQMYSNIQSMAANLSTDLRIASIAGGDGNDNTAVVGASLARSKMTRSLRQREAMSLLEGEHGAAHEELINEKALKVIRRVQDKLTGTDFQDNVLALDTDDEPLDVSDQVQRLIVQATSSENLCQLFIGWCAFW